MRTSWKMTCGPMVRKGWLLLCNEVDCGGEIDDLGSVNVDDIRLMTLEVVPPHPMEAGDREGAVRLTLCVQGIGARVAIMFYGDDRFQFAQDTMEMIEMYSMEMERMA